MVNDYNPDVLNCIANLSNDEVFTPPELANRMLDLLPQALFRSPKTTFLDPFTKSGVFLREIVKRLDRGLQDQIPDRQPLPAVPSIAARRPTARTASRSSTLRRATYYIGISATRGSMASASTAVPANPSTTGAPRQSNMPINLFTQIILNNSLIICILMLS